MNLDDFITDRGDGVYGETVSPPESKKTHQKKVTVAKKRTKEPKIGQTLTIEKWVHDRVTELKEENNRSFNYVVEKLLIHCFENGVKL